MKTVAATMGIALFTAIIADATTYYVSPGGTHSYPYNRWMTAATTIQAAVDATIDGDTVLVSNGVYGAGGKVIYGSLTNRVAIDRAILVQSINGPGQTFIVGEGPRGSNAVRCVYMTNGAEIVGFTITNGHTREFEYEASEVDQNGGGVWCESAGAVIRNCIITGCAAEDGGGVYRGIVKASIMSGNSARYLGACTMESLVEESRMSASSAGTGGGGACYGVVESCIIYSNYAGWSGGGAFASSVTNCVIFDNVSGNGGGTSFCTVRNSTICHNTGYAGSYYDSIRNCIIYYNNGYNYVGGGSDFIAYTCTTPRRGKPYNDPGIVTDEPLFVSIPNRDYHLHPQSPCIDRGINAESGSVDLDGIPRPLDGDGDDTLTADLGAYEFWQSALTSSNGIPYLQWPSASNAEYTIGVSTNLLNGFVALESNILGNPPHNMYTGILAEASAMFFRVELKR